MHFKNAKIAVLVGAALYVFSSVNTENEMRLFGLSRVMRSKFVQRKSKIIMYGTVVIPFLMYSAEA